MPGVLTIQFQKEMTEDDVHKVIALAARSGPCQVTIYDRSSDIEQSAEIVLDTNNRDIGALKSELARSFDTVQKGQKFDLLLWPKKKNRKENPAVLVVV